MVSPGSLKRMNRCRGFVDTTGDFVATTATTFNLASEETQTKNGDERAILKVNKDPVSPIGTVGGFKRVLLYELTHTSVTGYWDDALEGSCYG
ncbi:hypothetical protein HYFRA_00002232 [Hymenoscyphus fraxineus]|uniref:Uncharacterized protein n=1 Tax=Hymenoscyphus fraxineus TaxID=746836 RepID=A0A9N9PMV8_9HELO|nr:hypothetical protein HYFRA_00002232 [Hymenoscyphus fraxineus]